MVRRNPARENLNQALQRAERRLQDGRAHDAIVVGGGASGGLAASLLCEAGLDVLLLDAGWTKPFWRSPASSSVATALGLLANPWLLGLMHPKLVWKAQRALQLLGRVRQPVQSECYAWVSAPQSFVDDIDCPYETEPDAPFQWVRARQIGGRMTIPLHGRQYLRHGPRDFAPDDSLSPAWPLSYEELAPWYAQVERKLALAGGSDGCDYAPDSEVSERLEPTPAQAELMARVRARWPQASPVLGRYAPPFDSVGAAAMSGKLSLREGAIVREVAVDAAGRAEGVVFHDMASGTKRSARAPLIFLCASTIESTRILMLSRGRDGREIGRESNALGRFLMDHVTVKVTGLGGPIAGGSEQPPTGACVYLPRFDLRDGAATTPTRGYAVRVYQSPGPSGTSHFVAVSDAEMLPRADNRVILSDRQDAYGIPVPRIVCKPSEAERATADLQRRSIDEIMALLGVQPTESAEPPYVPGSTIHECGTARMGDDPATSVLDPTNQCWDVKGLFVTDGACFPSQGVQNPTLTIMALTARACAAATGEREPPRD